MSEKRFLSALMSLVLALGLCPLPAYAAPGGDDEPTLQGTVLVTADADDDDEDDDGDDEADDGEESSLISVAGVSGWTYDGKAHPEKLKPVAKAVDGSVLSSAVCKISFLDDEGEEIDPSAIVNAGEYSVYAEGVAGTGYEGESYELDFTVAKAPNTLSASAKAKTVTLKAKALKKKAGSVANVKVSGAQGAVAYKNASKNKVAKKFKVDAKGVVSVAKGAKKGKYPVIVQVTAKGDANHKASAAKKVAFTVRVK